jgi:bacillithiol biosynthesis cysteine-adding enzyme BshC
MTFRLLASPIPAATPPPVERHAAIAPAVADSLFDAPGVSAIRDRLRAPGALTVTTGQQPALFLGPAYSLYKALSAAALAGLLQERWGRPVVPVFWVAGDDHDWDEARSAHWIATDGELITAQLRPRTRDAPLTPLWRDPLTADVVPAIEEFRASHGDTPFATPVIDKLARHFRPGSTMSVAAGRMLAELLAPFGVAVLDSTAAAFKHAAAPFLVRALRERALLGDALVARDAALRASGHDAGVDVEQDASLVMLDGPDGRDRLVQAGNDFRLRRAGTTLSLGELERIAQEEPARLSANVLLRPALESHLLQTAAYCAGPGELRYLRLATAVFEALDVTRPAPVPRWSGLVVSAYTDRMLAKFDLSLEQLLDPDDDVVARAASARMPEAATAALRELRAAATESLGALAREATALAPPLGRSAEGSARRIEFEISRLERRLIRGLKRRHETELRQLVRARTFVLPAGRPQERILSGAGLLATYGAPLLEAVLDQARQGYRAALEGPPIRG